MKESFKIMSLLIATFSIVAFFSIFISSYIMKNAKPVTCICDTCPRGLACPEVKNVK